MFPSSKSRQHILAPKWLNRSIDSGPQKHTYCLSKRHQEQSHKRKVLGKGEEQNYFQEKYMFTTERLESLHYFYNLCFTT